MSAIDDIVENPPRVHHGRRIHRGWTEPRDDGEGNAYIRADIAERMAEALRRMANPPIDSGAIAYDHIHRARAALAAYEEETK